MQTVAFCEIDSFCLYILRKHWPNILQFRSVQHLTVERLQKHNIEKVDVICGGFPCQDISIMGKDTGLLGSRSGLWFEYLRIIKEVRPSWVIIENVDALRFRGLEQILRG